MPISGLRAISFFDDTSGSATEGTVVQCNDIDEQGEFYTGGLESEERDPTGGPVYAGDESFVEVMVYDLDAIAQLEAWMRAGTRVRMVAAGYQHNIQWYEYDKLEVRKTIFVGAGRRNKATIRMRRMGHGSHNIHGNVNLLAYLGWQVVKAAKQLNKYRKAMALFSEMAQAPDGAGNVADLRKTLVILCQEAANAGGRDNTEALVYRMGQVYRKMDEANKTIWAVNKDLVAKKKKEDWDE